MKAAQRIDLNLEQADGLLKRFEAGCLQASDYEIIKAMVETIELLSQCVDEKATVENAAADYTGAQQIKVAHATLKLSDHTLAV